MDWLRRSAEKPYTHLFLRGYERGTETGESYEEFLLLSELPPARAKASLNYSLLAELHKLGSEYYVWISKTLRPKPLTAPSARYLVLTIDSWVFWI